LARDTISSPLLYKYRAADDYSLDMLKGELYFARPQQLNDPTDLNLDRAAELQYQDRVVSLEEQIEKLEREVQAYSKIAAEMREMYLYLQSEADDIPPEWMLNEIASDEIAKLDRLTGQPPHRGRRKTLRSLAKTYKRKFEQANLDIENLKSLKQTWESWHRGNPSKTSSNRLSVLCLTANRDNYRMWTQYADGFRGVCIGLDRGLLERYLQGSGCDIHGPIRVVYRKITVDDLLSPRFYLREDNRYRYKPTPWSHEKEVRFVRRDGFGVVNVPTSCIKEIILGDRIDEEFHAEIMDEIRYGLMSETGSEDLGVYRAVGDSEGRVRILPEEELSKRIDELRAEMDRSVNLDVGTEKEENPLDEEVPPYEEDEIPF